MMQEETYLDLSGIQHFVFCRRQWALIHIEKLWAEDFHTMDGSIMHTRVHDEMQFEKRGDIITARAMRVSSASLQITGQCDVVEFHKNNAGTPLRNQSGLWQPYPVEYKRGNPKSDERDLLQLCAQAMCLEEMLCCAVPAGALYYGETRHRVSVDFTNEMQEQVRKVLKEMHQLYERGYTPKVKPKKSCSACSLKDLCFAKLTRTQSVDAYLKAHTEEETL